MNLKQLENIRRDVVEKGRREVPYNKGCLLYGVIVFTAIILAIALVAYEFEEDAKLMPFVIGYGSFFASLLPAYIIARLATILGLVSNIEEPSEIDWGNMFRKELLNQAIQPILKEKLPDLKPLEGALNKEEDWSGEDAEIMKLVRKVSGLNHDIAAWRWGDLRYSLSQTSFVSMEDGGASMTWDGHHPRACINYWCMLMPFETGEAKALITPTFGRFWSVRDPGDKFKRIPTDFEKFGVLATHPAETTLQLKKLISPLQNLKHKIELIHQEFKDSQGIRTKTKKELDLSCHFTVIIANNRIFVMLLAMRNYLSPIPIKAKISRDILKKYHKEVEAMEVFFRETQAFLNPPEVD